MKNEDDKMEIVIAIIKLIKNNRNSIYRNRIRNTSLVKNNIENIRNEVKI